MKRIVNALGKLNRGKWACVVFALCAATATALPAQTFTTLYRFAGAPADGATPVAGLVQATNGYLYGTTKNGGSAGDGTIFKIAPSGAQTTLYSFCCPYAYGLVAGLVQATNGNLYGTTEDGGACGSFNCGTVFKITPSGTLTSLYSFSTPYFPAAGLVQATNGYLYGTTQRGGAGESGAGTIFKMTPGGTVTTFYNFCSQGGCADGGFPSAGLIQATDGNLYGTAATGGTGAYGFEGISGTVFKITLSGTLTTLYAFCNQSGCADGGGPVAGLVQATDGNFYGTTQFGGAYSGGTVFKITPSGALTTLYSFCAQTGCADGEYPVAGLVQATDGNFYGTTENGGANANVYGTSAGTVFKITPSGTLTTVYNFCSESNCADGYTPVAGLVQATNGNLYGTTANGGSTCPYGCGTVFSLSVGLPAFVETQTTSAKVGAAVKILGNNLAHASSVTFNGTAAVFTASASDITATVPAGATTGTVQVVTPSGTLSSNLPFRVLPALSSFAPTHGAIGTVVTINGQSLTQTTGVTFGGVTAAFAVVSDSEVTATVPTGALTGSITVTTAGGVATG
jgi:uncharacterized repeat protein (TIGR03803 family)